MSENLSFIKSKKSRILSFKKMKKLPIFLRINNILLSEEPLFFFLGKSSPPHLTSVYPVASFKEAKE
jgi:hypothetical protein